MKIVINPFTGLPQLVGDGGGGGGGDGVKKINGKSPDSSGNYVIKADDIPIATTTSSGGAPIATSQEAIDGTVDNKIISPKTLSDALNAQSGKPLPFIRFNSSTKAETNHAYGLVDPDPNPPVPLELPDRGQFKAGDILEVDNVSGVSFKITIPSDIIIRYDDQILDDISGKFLLSQGSGSSIKLRAEDSQLWYVVRKDRVAPATSEGL